MNFKDLESSDAVKELYSKQHEAGLKFDYFVCGVAGAIFAYISQNYAPQKLALDFPLLEPISLLLIAAAFYFGIKRLEAARTLVTMNHQVADCEDKAKKLAVIVANPQGYRDFDGKVCTAETVQREQQGYIDASRGWYEQINICRAMAVRYYKLRDNLLILGFAAIFLAKVLQPYGKGKENDGSPLSTLPAAQLTNVPPVLKPVNP